MPTPTASTPVVYSCDESHFNPEASGGSASVENDPSKLHVLHQSIKSNELPSAGVKPVPSVIASLPPAVSICVLSTMPKSTWDVRPLSLNDNVPAGIRLSTFAPTMNSLPLSMASVPVLLNDTEFIVEIVESPVLRHVPALLIEPA